MSDVRTICLRSCILEFEAPLTFDLDVGSGLGAAGGRGRLARVRRGVGRADNVERESTQAVLVVGRAVRHRRAVAEPLDQRAGRVAFQTTLEREPAPSTSSSSSSSAAAAATTTTRPNARQLR